MDATANDEDAESGDGDGAEQEEDDADVPHSDDDDAWEAKPSDAAAQPLAPPPPLNGLMQQLLQKISMRKEQIQVAALE